MPWRTVYREERQKQMLLRYLRLRNVSLSSRLISLRFKVYFCSSGSSIQEDMRRANPRKRIPGATASFRAHWSALLCPSWRRYCPETQHLRRKDKKTNASACSPRCRHAFELTGQHLDYSLSCCGLKISKRNAKGRHLCCAVCY